MGFVVYSVQWVAVAVDWPACGTLTCCLPAGAETGGERTWDVPWNLWQFSWESSQSPLLPFGAGGACASMTC